MRVYKGGKFPNIDRWMREKGVTVKEFAQRTGVSRSTMLYALNGTHVPGLYTIRAILRATGMTFEEAFREGEP